MSDESIPVVAIIGGGFCGMVTAVNLFQSPVPIEIVIVNDGYPFGKGVAYSAHSEKYLLNVRAVNMSAYADMPQHFLDWVCAVDKYRNISKNIMTNQVIQNLLNSKLQIHHLLKVKNISAIHGRRNV